MAEVHHVVNIVHQLVNINRVQLKDIGIISPYRRQVDTDTMHIYIYIYCFFFIVFTYFRI